MVSSTSPLVSVVCHAFNHQAYIRQTIESILAQSTSFPFELIIHDDASSDGTSEIVYEFARRYPRVVSVVVQDQNQFSQGKRPPYFTFPMASGEYLAICEGDDYWVDPQKLEKQVNAMRMCPGVKLCVHPAQQLSVSSGKTKVAFHYGVDMRIIDLDTVIARHNQFAPTASMLMRTDAAQSMPAWFFNEPDLPVGDAFLEALLGCNGVLYLPDVMSVYRRGVDCSYTRRFQVSGGHALEESLSKMLHYTQKLAGMPGVSPNALKQRLAYIRLNYALQCLAVNDHERFARISSEVDLPQHKALMAVLKVLRSNRSAFALGRVTFLQFRRLKN